MTDVSARRRETGSGTAGRFAAEAHSEPSVTVAARRTREDLDAWCADGLGCVRDTAETIDTRIRAAADGAAGRQLAERRATLLDQQARLAEELAALDAIDVKGQA